MCTAITYKTDDFYFGRNLDIVRGYGERVAITPRNYRFVFRNGEESLRHHAIIGVAAISGGYPLYYDAVNEKGLCLAGLNFPGNAVYNRLHDKKKNITPFELIPWILGSCESVDDALSRLENINLWNEPFDEKLPLTPLHWLLADSERAITLEPTEKGLEIYENPLGVLTNNPPFDYHMHNLANHMNLTPFMPENRFCRDIELSPYSLGMGAIGLPGDTSSASRFVKAAFVKLNSVSGTSEEESVSQFFHILGSVGQQRGVTRIREDEYEYTLYSGCCNATRGIYYYTTYENSRITTVDMHRENLNGEDVISYPLIWHGDIFRQN